MKRARCCKSQYCLDQLATMQSPEKIGQLCNNYCLNNYTVALNETNKANDSVNKEKLLNLGAALLYYRNFVSALVSSLSNQVNIKKQFAISFYLA